MFVENFDCRSTARTKTTVVCFSALKIESDWMEENASICGMCCVHNWCSARLQKMGKYTSSECICICIYMHQNLRTVWLPFVASHSHPDLEAWARRSKESIQLKNLQHPSTNWPLIFYHVQFRNWCLLSKLKGRFLRHEWFFFFAETKCRFFRAKAEAMAAGNLVSWQYLLLLAMTSLETLLGNHTSHDCKLWASECLSGGTGSIDDIISEYINMFRHWVHHCKVWTMRLETKWPCTPCPSWTMHNSSLNHSCSYIMSIEFHITFMLFVQLHLESHSFKWLRSKRKVVLWTQPQYNGYIMRSVNFGSSWFGSKPTLPFKHVTTSANMAVRALFPLCSKRCGVQGNEVQLLSCALDIYKFAKQRQAPGHPPHETHANADFFQLLLRHEMMQIAYDK